MRALFLENFRPSPLFLLALLSALVAGCEQSSPAPQRGVFVGEYIARHASDNLLDLKSPERLQISAYPWDATTRTPLPPITKHYFQCRGCLQHPPKMIQRGGESIHLYDCRGGEQHSLPLRDGQEWIAPLLLVMLNFCQERFERPVHITCGHCCLDHRTYLYPHASSEGVGHVLGAEVDFYVEGWESRPERVVQALLEFYRTRWNHDQHEKGEFSYDEKDGSRFWKNREVVLSIHAAHLGRDEDNNHSYPYLTIRVRYDKESKDTLKYSWDRALKSYYRY